MAWWWIPIQMLLRIEAVWGILMSIGHVSLRVLDAVLPPLQPVLIDEAAASATAAPPSKDAVLKSNQSALKFMLGVYSCSYVTMILMAATLGLALITAAVIFCLHIPQAWTQVTIQYGLDKATNGICQEGGGVRIDKQLNVVCNAAKERMSMSYWVTETVRKAFDATPFCFVSCVDFFDTLTPLALRVLLIAAACGACATFAAWMFSRTATKQLKKKLM
jgi:hypothetical protein